MGPVTGDSTDVPDLIISRTPHDIFCQHDVCHKQISCAYLGHSPISWIILDLFLIIWIEYVSIEVIYNPDMSQVDPYSHLQSYR